MCHILPPPLVPSGPQLPQFPPFFSPYIPSERTLFFPTAAANFAAGGCGAWWTTLRFPFALEKFRFSLLRSWLCVCEGLRAIDVCVRRTRFSPYFPPRFLFTPRAFALIGNFSKNVYIDTNTRVFAFSSFIVPFRFGCNFSNRMRWKFRPWRLALAVE